MEEKTDEKVWLVRPKSAYVFSLLNLFIGGRMPRIPSLTAGISKYKRHQGAKEMARRLRRQKDA